MSTKKRQQYRHLPAFILLALTEGPIHGGAVHAALTGRMPVFKTDTGAVYRALQQLEREGAVISSWDTSGTGPARRIYSITQEGWARLEFWKQDIEQRLTNLNYFLDTYNRLTQKGKRRKNK